MSNLNRRTFLKGVGASGAAAMAVGCDGAENLYEARTPIEKVLPYVVQPEQIIPGVPTWFASRCGGCSAGCGIVARVREGRVNKLEGNPDHPINQGALCSVGQQEILEVYSPDRFTGPLKARAQVTWDDALATAAAAISSARTAGKEIAWVGYPRTGSFADLTRQFVQAAGGRVVYWGPLEHESLRAAARTVFGKDEEPRYILDDARTIVSFGAEFLSGWGDMRVERGWANSRDPKLGGFVSRTICVESRLGNTSAAADVHLRAMPGTETGLALALAKLVAAKNGYSGPASATFASVDPAQAAQAAQIRPELLEQVAGWIAEGNSVILPGGLHTAAAATSLAVASLILNEVAGNIGRSVVFGSTRNLAGVGTFADVSRLLEDARAGRIGVLMMDELDLAYLLPKSANVAEALAAVGQVIAFVNEPTDSLPDNALVLPPGTPLETWGDGEAYDGIYTIQQPAMRPLHDTRNPGDVLLALARAAQLSTAAPTGTTSSGVAVPVDSAAQTGTDAQPGTTPSNPPAAGEPAAIVENVVPAAGLPTLVAESYLDYLAGWWRAVVFPKAGGGSFERFWTDVLQRGGHFIDMPNESASFVLGQAVDAAPATIGGAGEYYLTLFPHPFILDGRHANKPWAQEIPEPISSYTWGTWVEINPETAAKIGLGEDETVEVGTENGSIEVGWFGNPTIRPDTIAVVLGNGHERSGRYTRFGANPMKLLGVAQDGQSGAMAYVSKASLKATGKESPLHPYLGSLTLEGRGVNFAVSVDDLGAGGAPGSIVPAHHVPVDQRLIDAGLDDMYPEPEHPTYRFAMAIDNNRCTGCGACETACYAENNIPFVGPEQIKLGRRMGWIRLSRYFEGTEEQPDVRFQVNLCQQCSHAPCEGVCPVLATYHNLDGLNAMIYNRCVGTRYCGNNCPYTARRFNYHTFKWPESYNMMLNTEVSTREMGVMEKCTFCVQRLREAKDTYRDQGRIVPDEALFQITACAQACPTEAITFGNAKDLESQVLKLWNEPRTYTMLGELNTKPGVRYLSKIVHTPSKLHGHGGGHGDSHGDAGDHGGGHGTDEGAHH